MVVEFPPFRVDREQGRLWRYGEEVALRRKTWELLCYFLSRPGELVTTEDLVEAVWARAVVQDAVVTNCVYELRRKLGDDRRKPRFIEAVHGRGFRWIAAAETVTRNAAEQRPGLLSTVTFAAGVPRASCVGRDAELQRLHASWTMARSAQRQVVLISGEPGIGKTTLLSTFLAALAKGSEAHYGSIAGDGGIEDGSAPLVIRGQCVEVHGGGEPYLPLLDAIGQVSSGSVLEALRRCAPTWLAQMPWVLGGEAAREVERAASVTTKERMLRELGAALDTIAGRHGLALVLEDLHWADASTLDALSFLIRRDPTAHLLVIATYRPADATVQRGPLHAFADDLLARSGITEIALENLSAPTVQTYLDVRFVGHDFPPVVADTIVRHTNGHPMFMSVVVDELVHRGCLAEHDGCWRAAENIAELEIGLPESLKRMIDTQLERLGSEDIALLEAASVAGVEFTSQELSSALEREPDEIEDWCDRFVQRRQFLHDGGSCGWPDGSRGERYAFAHSLYQRALLQRIPSGRRKRLHGRIGTRLAQGYAQRLPEVAIQLARHFEGAADVEQCARYLVLSGRTALRRASPQAARETFRQAIEMAGQAPDRVRQRREVEAWSGMAAALLYSDGLAAADVCSAFERVEELSRELRDHDDAPLVLEALFSAWAFRFSRGEMARATDLAERLASVGQALGARGHLSTLAAEGATLFMRGELQQAHEALERARNLKTDRGDDTELSDMSRAHAFGFGAHVECLRGRVDRALELAKQAADLARTLAHPLSEMLALHTQLLLATFTRDSPVITRHSAELSRFAEQHSLPLFAAWARLYRNWMRAREGDPDALAELDTAALVMQFAGFEAVAVGVDWLRADALVQSGQIDTALTVLDRTLGRLEVSGIRCIEAELYRLRGEALVRQATATFRDDAERCFRQAVAVAERQGARWWELRARASLVRLAHGSPQWDATRRDLGVLCDSFTEGSDTEDLREARRLVHC